MDRARSIVKRAATYLLVACAMVLLWPLVLPGFILGVFLHQHPRRWPAGVLSALLVVAAEMLSRSEWHFPDFADLALAPWILLGFVIRWAIAYIFVLPGYQAGQAFRRGYRAGRYSTTEPAIEA